MAIVFDPPQLPRTRRTSGRDWRGWRSRYCFYHQLEERFPDDHLVARLELGRTARREARLTIHVGAVETADVLDRDLAAVDSNQRMLARDLGFGIVGVEIHFRKRSRLGIPSADQVVAVFERKFLALASAAVGTEGALSGAASGLISPVGASDLGISALGVSPSGFASAAAAGVSAGALPAEVGAIPAEAPPALTSLAGLDSAAGAAAAVPAAAAASFAPHPSQ